MIEQILFTSLYFYHYFKKNLTNKCVNILSRFEIQTMKTRNYEGQGAQEKRVSFRIIRSQSYRCTESGSGPLVKRSTVHLPHGIIHCLYFSTLFQYALRRHRPPCHSSSCRPHFSLSIV